MGTCGHDASYQFGERLLVHVEVHGANGRRDCVQSCGSHTGYILQDMCRGSFLSEFSSTNSFDKLSMPQPVLETTGGLSVVHVKEIFTSQAGPMVQLTGSGIMMLGSSRALWRYTLKG